MHKLVVQIGNSESKCMPAITRKGDEAAMKFLRRVSEGPNQTVVAAVVSKNGRNRARGIFACCGVICALVGSAVLFSQSKPASQPAPSAKATASRAPAQASTDAQMARMSSDELAHYVFEHHGCNGCHTLGANGKLGFTERGKTVGKGFEGCISLLTSMNVIAQVKETDRSAEEKHKAARFQEFGCTTCHQITPGKLGLTAYGTKLKSFHMACTDVERILAAQKH
jgi:cytochrome c551/c552